MRRIIQIAIAGHENVASTQCNFSIIALAADGTAWMTDNQSIQRQADDDDHAIWTSLPPLPEPAP